MFTIYMGSDHYSDTSVHTYETYEEAYEVIEREGFYENNNLCQGDAFAWIEDASGAVITLFE